MVENGWIIKVQRKDFVTFSGLLWLGRQMGVCSIETTPILADYDNGRFVFQTTVAGIQGTYTTEGEASKENTSRNMFPYLRSLAGTRSTARALRLYTAVGLTAYEELNHDTFNVKELPPTVEPKKEQVPKVQAPKVQPKKFKASEYTPLVEFLEANKHNAFRTGLYGTITPVEYVERYYKMKFKAEKYHMKNWTQDQTDSFIAKLKSGEVKIEGLLVS